MFLGIRQVESVPDTVRWLESPQSTFNRPAIVCWTHTHTRSLIPIFCAGRRKLLKVGESFLDCGVCVCGRGGSRTVRRPAL